MTVLFQKLNPAACLPRRATLGSAGYDLCACIERPLTVKPGQTVPVPTGLAMALPKGYGGFVLPAVVLASAMAWFPATAWASSTQTIGARCWWGCITIPIPLTPFSQESGLPSWSCWKPPCGRQKRWILWMIPTGEPVDLAPPEADREEHALRMKKNLILLFLLLAGVMFGSLLAAATRGIPWLSWLSYGQTVGISVDNPMILDLAVIQLAFGFELGVNIAQIICVLIAIFA